MSKRVNGVPREVGGARTGIACPRAKSRRVKAAITQSSGSRTRIPSTNPLDRKPVARRPIDRHSSRGYLFRKRERKKKKKKEPDAFLSSKSNRIARRLNRLCPKSPLASASDESDVCLR